MARGEVTPGGSHAAIRAIIDELIRQRDTLGRSAQTAGLFAANTAAITYWRERLDAASRE